MLFACSPLPPPPSLSPLQLTLIHFMHAFLHADSAKGGVCLYLCVWEGGRGISFNPSALLCDSPSSHIYSVSSLCLSFFLTPVFPFLSLFVSCHFSPPSFCIRVFLMSDIHVHLTQAYSLGRTGSPSPVSYHSTSLSSLSPPAQPLGFRLLLLLHHSHCVLHLLLGSAHCVRNQQHTEVGVFLSASSLGLRLHRSLSLTTLSSCLPSHFTLSMTVGLIALVCSYGGANAVLSVCGSI